MKKSVKIMLGLFATSSMLATPAFAASSANTAINMSGSLEIASITMASILPVNFGTFVVKAVPANVVAGTGCEAVAQGAPVNCLSTDVGAAGRVDVTVTDGIDYTVSWNSQGMGSGTVQPGSINGTGDGTAQQVFIAPTLNFTTMPGAAQSLSGSITTFGTII